MRRDGGTIGRECHGDGTATFVDRAQSIEDEVTDAVEDGSAMVLLRGLERVGVMSNNQIGSCINEAMCIDHLLEDGAHGVLSSPMEGNDDVV